VRYIGKSKLSNDINLFKQNKKSETNYDFGFFVFELILLNSLYLVDCILNKELQFL